MKLTVTKKKMQLSAKTKKTGRQQSNANQTELGEEPRSLINKNSILSMRQLEADFHWQNIMQNSARFLM